MDAELLDALDEAIRLLELKSYVLGMLSDALKKRLERFKRK